jgi:hypothetical protein
VSALTRTVENSINIVFPNKFIMNVDFMLNLILMYFNINLFIFF